MRIAMISTPFLSVPPHDYGGTELVVHELTEGLVALGHEVTLFATGDSHTSASLRWLYRQGQWPPTTLADLNHVSWSFARVAAGRFDLIHTHSAVGLGFGRVLSGVPLVYTIHHEREDNLSAFYRCVPEAHYVAVSADQKMREVPLKYCEVIHHGLNASAYELSDHPGDYVVFLGRMARVKGPHTAIDVAAKAGLPIRVAGEVHPPDRWFAERELEYRFRLPHVSFVGCLSLEEKVPLLRDARALLAPMEWNEPFGLVMIEAMLSGCPVVALPRGSVPEVVESGVTGFIAESPDQMAAIIRPGGPLERFDRNRCRERAKERFSRERLTADYERLYRRILRRGARPAPVGQLARPEASCS
jgi:glycosyltransferase involved in cell wall biosynthesis